MYNFVIISQFKVWFDCVLVVGCIFCYGLNGLEGLVGGKCVIIVFSCGGKYSEGLVVVMDFQEFYLCMVLGFIGIIDVEFICVEGVVMGDDVKQIVLQVVYVLIGQLVLCKVV